MLYIIFFDLIKGFCVGLPQLGHVVYVHINAGLTQILQYNLLFYIWHYWTLHIYSIIYHIIFYF